MKRGWLNLRKGEFIYRGELQEVRRVLRVPALLLALIVVISFYRGGAHYFELKSRAKMLETEIQTTPQKNFPGVKTVPKPAAFMETEVSKIKAKLAQIEAIVSSPSPLEILREISQRVPSDVRVQVEEINLTDEKNIRMRGKCNSYEEVARIEKGLSESSLFEQVTRDYTDTAQGGVKFQLTLVMRKNA